MSTTNRPDEPYLDEASSADGRGTPWWRNAWVAGVVLFAAIVGFGAWIVYGLGERPGMAGGDMSGMDEMAADVPRVPPVFGYYADREVFFIHTEASDPEVARTLEGMMGSPVPAVPSLADVPEDARANVYVFANGLRPRGTPAGPLGFQPDVFDSAPADPEYTPLREIVFVVWADEGEARLLTSAEEIHDAEAAGEVSLDESGVVVNMPLLTWPGGER